MMWPDGILARMQPEIHFDNRRLQCFTDRPGDLDEMFQNTLAAHGGSAALVDGDTRLNYRQLADLVARLAAGFVSLGIKKNDRIALLIGNRAEFVYVLLASLRIGAIAVPINIREQTPELTYILNHCGAKLLVHEHSVSARLPAQDATPDLHHRYDVDAAACEPVAFSRLLENSDQITSAADLREEDVAVILYTSGTTGLPKGAMLTHFNIIHSVMHFALCMELKPGDEEKSLLAVPASHVTGLLANLAVMLLTGGCNVILPAFDAEAFLQLAARERITHTVLVPAMYNLCLLRADFGQFDLGAWRIGGYGGAPMPESTIAELAEKLPALTLINAYGSTEVSSPATLMPPGLGASNADSVGICVPCGDIRIVDETGSDVAAGEHGEIWIAGPMVVPGYWHNEEKTRESFNAGYWKSGDIGSRDTAGFIRLHDRKKDMIIRGGYNIYSAEIENVLSAHADVIECAVIGRPDPVLGEKTQVYVYAGSATPDTKELKSFCADHLADYKVPDFITYVADLLPRNANGKVLKKQLRAWPAPDQ